LPGCCWRGHRCPEKAAKPAPDAYQLVNDREHAAKSQDDTRALIPDYEALANAGDARAMFRLVNLVLLLGDKDASAQWLRRMAGLNGPKGQYYLAAALPGTGDCTESRGLLEKSANGGYDVAISALAFNYSEGRCGPRDVEKAAVWYEKAARLGIGVAQHNLGWAYLYGDGVERNLVTAYAWFELASRQPRGDPRVQDWNPFDATEAAQSTATRLSPADREKGWKLAQTLCTQDQVCGRMREDMRQQIMAPFTQPSK
jgi:TPR repeat protein